MNGWLTFWIVTVIISYIIFFGVAIVVGIKGWEDLRYLFDNLKKLNKDSSEHFESERKDTE